MKLSLARIKGLGFILWHARHQAVHVSFGLIWAWVLRELWHQFNTTWIFVSILGSEIPDTDTLFYIFLYGRKEPIALQMKKFLRNHEWRAAAVFYSKEHKYNTNLMYHNYYFILFLFILAIISSLINWHIGIIFFGAMIIHYIIDITDDLIVLGKVNQNWKRWGKPKRKLNPEYQ
jgi:hypothetical protein